MRGRIEDERGACVAIVEALSQINIPTEVISFQNICRIDINYSDEAYKTYNRVEPFTFVIFKHFDEDYKRIKTRFVNYEYYPQGNNSDPEAIFFVAKRLSMRPEKRKILIVLTDGHPEAECFNRDALSTATQDVIKQIIKSDIEVIGIGMEYSNVKEYYPNYIIINNMEMLAPSLFKLLEKAKIGK
jgi:cobalamin biosynthesis protein CobT